MCWQGKEPSVRQLALLHFRNIITLNLKLDEALSRPRARVPPSIIQMLLILQVCITSRDLYLTFSSLKSLSSMQTLSQTHILHWQTAVTDVGFRAEAKQTTDGRKRSRGHRAAVFFSQRDLTGSNFSRRTGITAIFPWPLCTLSVPSICEQLCSCLFVWMIHVYAEFKTAVSSRKHKLRAHWTCLWPTVQLL